MSKERESKTKFQAEFVERSRAWADAKTKEDTHIARISDKVREKADIDARARKNANTVHTAAVEAVAKIRFSDKIQGSKREKAEAEAWKKVEAEMK